MPDPDLLEMTLVVKVKYSPDSGMITVSDGWEHPDGHHVNMALLTCYNTIRCGRETMHREVKQTVGQYMDIMDGRWAETT
jgi:hypothetical protein